ncbi:MAG: sugar phosphate isomerase/epimerase [Bacteroidetes bacterium]|nr:sugar phosphate isomerase/epimerase [Bacteroidota bacterium]
MKFAINENTLFSCDVLEFIDACSNVGFEAVELSYPKLKEILKFVPVPELVEQIQSAGVKVLSLNAFEDALLVPETGMAAISAEAAHIGELCQVVDCPAVVLPSSRWYPKYGEVTIDDNFYALYRNRLKYLKKVFSRYGVEAMFEPIAYDEFYLGNVEEVNRLLDDPELQDIRLVPDIHNLYKNGQGPEQLLKYANKIGLFHIDDTVNGDLKTLHVAFDRTYPGKGQANAAGWLKAAEKAGYDGYYSLELFNDDLYQMDPKKAASECMYQLVAFEKSLG